MTEREGGYDLAGEERRKRVRYLVIFPLTLAALAVAIPLAFRHLPRAAALWVVLSIVGAGQQAGADWERGAALGELARGVLLSVLVAAPVVWALVHL